MEWTNKIGDGVKRVVEPAAKFLQNGMHAQQDIPGQHRLLAAGGMFTGWIALDKLRDIMFGFNQVSEGEYKEIKSKDVPAPLRFLHKTIDWNPHSDSPDEQWKKLAHQLIPAVGAGVGTVAGSMWAFNRNGVEQNMKGLKASKTQKFFMDAEAIAEHSHSKPLRILTAASGGFAAASMMPLVYGALLNLSFASANGARIFAGNLGMGNLGPAKALDAQLKGLAPYAKSAVNNDGKISDAWAKGFVDKVLTPLFGKDLKTPEAQIEVRNKIKGIVQNTFKKLEKTKFDIKDPVTGITQNRVLTKDELAEALTKDVEKTLGYTKDPKTGKILNAGFDKTLEELGLHRENATLGNAIPAVRGFHEFLAKTGIVKSSNSWLDNAQTAQSTSNTPAILAAGAATAAAAGAVMYQAKKPSKSTSPSENSSATSSAPNTNTNSAAIAPISISHTIDINGHGSPSTEGKTAAEYVFDAMKLHQEQYQNQGKAPPKILKWIGDASLAVPPINRMFSAIGLTSGLLVAGNMANIVTGRKLSDGSAIAKEKVPTFLQGIHRLVKNYEPKMAAVDSRSKWIRYAHIATYSAGGLLGVKFGSDYAYKDTKAKSENPHYLEEYLTNVSHTQGKTWSWLSATSGIFGSAAGTWAVPIPGLNYAVGMVGRVTSMQDRNTMISGLNKYTSDATTTSYLRLKEGVHYLAHHAIENPAKDPVQIEYLAYTLLGPIFKDKLTAEHIKLFTDAVNTVRDKYWQEGGIPKDKKEEATNTMKEVFTGAGLEVLLIDMGLNPATIRFDKVNGLIGKIGDIGHKKELHEKQEAYWKELEGRLEKYVNAGIVSKERAEWVKEGIKDTRKGLPQDSPPPPFETSVSASSLISTYGDKTTSGTVASSLGIKSKQSSIENLVRSAEKQGDWRETILERRQDMATPSLVHE
ncbi:MAG: hypothetical protein ABL857_00540 [Rickettsiales bacterium]